MLIGMTGLAEPVVADESTTKRLAQLKQSIRKDYADVRHLSIADFVQQTDQVTLIDVRERREYEVSRIPGALHIAEPEALLAYAQAHPQAQLVLYCSVGVRSAKAAQYLGRQGITKVANLEGSIFEWSNQHRPLENASGATRAVHPYNRWWGFRYLQDYPLDEDASP